MDLLIFSRSTGVTMPKYAVRHRGLVAVCICIKLHKDGIDYSDISTIPFYRLPQHLRTVVLEKVGSPRCRDSMRICSECVQLYSHPITNPTPIPDTIHLTNDSENVEEEEVGVYVSLANCHQAVLSMSPNLRAKLAFELARAERDQIRTNTLELTKQPEGRVFTTLNQSVEHGNSENLVLLRFLEGLCDSADSYYKLCKAKELCMSLTTTVAILPLHFREILILYALSRSRSAVELLTGQAPHGGYHTIRRALEMNCGKTNTDMEDTDGDSIVVFDNNQVLQRRWQIATSNTVTCSVITMVVHLEIDPLTNLQRRPNLLPSEWMWSTDIEAMAAKLKKAGTNPTDRDTYLNTHLTHWLEPILRRVAADQVFDVDMDTISDDIDKLVARQEQSNIFKKCPGCGYDSIPKRRQICPSCHQNIVSLRLQTKTISTMKKRSKKQTSQSAPDEVRVLINRQTDDTYKLSFTSCSTDSSPYSHLSNMHTGQPPKVTVGKPVFVNPCSYEAVAHVFREIGKQAGIRRYGGEREWMTVVCDGLPYVMGYQLIEKLYVCSVCNDTHFGHNAGQKHQSAHEAMGEACTLIQEFEWLLLQPGPGHIEMNMLKGFVKLMWVPYWETMVEIFNYRSENAKRSAKKVTDHHKGFTLARIAREAWAAELLLPYVRNNIRAGVPVHQLTIIDFLAFCGEAVSKNYAFMLDMTFTLLDSLFVYRAGVRAGLPSLMDLGRNMYAPLWSARSHPMYRQLEVYDSIVSECMPESIKSFIEKTKSVNTSGIPYTGEGADFKLEEVNRGVQHWIPASPQDKDWLQACANYKTIGALHTSTLASMGLTDKNARTVKPTESSISAQVLAFRAKIRASSYLLHPEEEGTLTTLTGEPLDMDLNCFMMTARKKRDMYIDCFIKHQQQPTNSTVPFKEAPLFVTENERVAYHSIGKQTIAVLKGNILKKIATIGEGGMRHNFQVAFQEEVLATNPRKQDLVDFHELLEEYISTLEMDVETLVEEQ